MAACWLRLHLVALVALVAGIAPGAAWATLQPAAGTDPDHPALPGAQWPTSPPSIRAGSCQAMRPAGRTWWRRSGPHRDPGTDQGRRSPDDEEGLNGACMMGEASPGRRHRTGCRVGHPASCSGHRSGPPGPTGGTVAHLAAFDPRRQLPGDAVKPPAPGGDGPGRTVVLAPIRGTVQRRVQEGWRPVEGVLRLRLVAGIAPGAAWAALQPAAGADQDHPARPGRRGPPRRPRFTPAAARQWTGPHRGLGTDQRHRSTGGEGWLAGD